MRVHNGGCNWQRDNTTGINFSSSGLKYHYHQKPELFKALPFFSSKKALTVAIARLSYKFSLVMKVTFF